MRSAKCRSAAYRQLVETHAASPELPRRRPDPRRARRAARARGPRSRHRVPDPHPGDGDARPAAGRIYYTTLGDEKARSETGAGARPRHAVPAPPGRPAGCGCGACPSWQFFFDESIEQQRPHRAHPPGTASRRAERPPAAGRPATPTTPTPTMTTDQIDRSPDRCRRPHLRRDPRAAAVPAHLARPARRRLDRLAAGDGVRARGARQGGAASSTPTRRRSTTWSSPGVDRIEIARARRATDADALIVMECSDLTRTGVSGPRGALHRSTSITTPATRRYGALNWFDESAAACGEMVFDLIEALGVPLTDRDRDAHLPGDPHRHRVVPSLEHHAADVRHLPADGRGGRQSGGHGAAGVRQQQLRQAEADRRAAGRDGAARRRPARGRCT